MPFIYLQKMPWVSIINSVLFRYFSFYKFLPLSLFSFIRSFFLLFSSLLLSFLPPLLISLVLHLQCSFFCVSFLLYVIFHAFIDYCFYCFLCFNFSFNALIFVLLHSCSYLCRKTTTTFLPGWHSKVITLFFAFCFSLL